MREYISIKDCWNAAREAKTVDELENLICEFPRWSGDWTIDTTGGSVTLINRFWDEELQDEFEDEEELDILVEAEEDEA